MQQLQMWAVPHSHPALLPLIGCFGFKWKTNLYTWYKEKIVWAWWSTARGVTKSRIRLSDWHFAFSPRRPSPGPHTPARVRVTAGVCRAREGVCALPFLTRRKVTRYKCHCVSFFQLTIYLKHGSRWRHTDLPGYYNGSRCSAAQSCLTLSDPVDCNPSGSSVHGISQARIPEWDPVSFSRGSSWPWDWTCVSCISCIGRWFLYHSATRGLQSMGSQSAGHSWATEHL